MEYKNITKTFSYTEPLIKENGNKIFVYNVNLQKAFEIIDELLVIKKYNLQYNDISFNLGDGAYAILNTFTNFDIKKYCQRKDLEYIKDGWIGDPGIFYSDENFTSKHQSFKNVNAIRKTLENIIRDKHSLIAFYNKNIRSCGFLPNNSDEDLMVVTFSNDNSLTEYQYYINDDIMRETVLTLIKYLKDNNTTLKYENVDEVVKSIQKQSSEKLILKK